MNFPDTTHSWKIFIKENPWWNLLLFKTLQSFSKFSRRLHILFSTLHKVGSLLWEWIRQFNFRLEYVQRVNEGFKLKVRRFYFKLSHEIYSLIRIASSWTQNWYCETGWGVEIKRMNDKNPKIENLWTFEYLEHFLTYSVADSNISTIFDIFWEIILSYNWYLWWATWSYTTFPL